jgi:hypothetical protein
LAQPASEKHIRFWAAIPFSKLAEHRRHIAKEGLARQNQGSSHCCPGGSLFIRNPPVTNAGKKPRYMLFLQFGKGE